MTKDAPRKRANVAQARATFEAILKLTKDIDWDTDVSISDLIEVARLARHGLSSLPPAEA